MIDLFTTPLTRRGMRAALRTQKSYIVSLKLQLDKMIKLNTDMHDLNDKLSKENENLLTELKKAMNVD
jgi:hypothetical protein